MWSRSSSLYTFQPRVLINTPFLTHRHTHTHARVHTYTPFTIYPHTLADIFFYPKTQQHQACEAVDGLLEQIFISWTAFLNAWVLIYRTLPQRSWHLVGGYVQRMQHTEVPSKYKIAPEIIVDKLSVVSRTKVLFPAQEASTTEWYVLILWQNVMPWCSPSCESASLSLFYVLAYTWAFASSFYLIYPLRCLFIFYFLRCLFKRELN